MTLPNKSGTASMSQQISGHSCMQQSFQLLFSIFGIIFAHNFYMSKSSVRTFQMLTWHIPRSYAISQTVTWQSILTASMAHSILTWVQVIMSLPPLVSTCNYWHPSLNLQHHWTRRECGMISYSIHLLQQLQCFWLRPPKMYTCCSNYSTSDWVLPKCTLAAAITVLLIESSQNVHLLQQLQCFWLSPPKMDTCCSNYSASDWVLHKCTLTAAITVLLIESSKNVHLLQQLQCFWLSPPKMYWKVQVCALLGAHYEKIWSLHKIKAIVTFSMGDYVEGENY